MRIRTIMSGLIAVAIGTSLLWLWLAPHGAEPVADARLDRHERKREILRIPRVARNAGIAGRVSAAKGSLGVATVCATCANCEITGTRDQVCVAAGDDGRYLLGGLGTSGYRVTASAHGYAVGTANQGRPLFVKEGGSIDGVDIVLSTLGEQVVGHVFDATGGPIAGANVRLVSWSVPPVVTELSSDQDGRFEGYTAAGRLNAIASAPGYSSASIYRYAPSNDITIALTPESLISGMVVTAGDERPIAGAELVVVAEGLSAVSAHTSISEGDGRFRVDGLAPGRYLLSATAPGYRSVDQYEVELPLGAHVSGVRVPMTKAAQVHGRVVIAPDDAPCQQGYVMLGSPHPRLGLRPGSKWTEEAFRAQPPAPTTLMARIGANGEVHFDAAPDGHYFANVECEGYQPKAGPDTLHVHGGDVEGLVWHVVQATRLSIRVVDEQGAPVTGARLELKWPDTPSQGGVRNLLETDRSGVTPPVGDLYPGVYTASALDGYEADPTPIEIKSHSADVQATLVLRGKSRIEVEVLDHEGRAVDGLRVTAQRCDAAEPVANPSVEQHSDAPVSSILPAGLVATGVGAGRYRIAAVAAGCYRVDAWDFKNPKVGAKDGRGATSIQVEAGAVATVRVTLQRKGEISGRVLSSAGEPVADVWVSAVAPGTSIDPGLRTMLRGLMHANGRVLSDQDGRFTLGELDPATSYDVTAEQTDGTSVLVRAARADKPLTMTLPEPGTIEGMVTDARGQAIDAFTLRIVESNTQRDASRDFTRARGRFSIGGVTPGQLEIQATDGTGQLAATLRAELKSGQRLSGLRLTLPERVQ